MWINCTKTQDPRVVCEASLAKLYCDYKLLQLSNGCGWLCFLSTKCVRCKLSSVNHITNHWQSLGFGWHGWLTPKIGLWSRIQIHFWHETGFFKSLLVRSKLHLEPLTAGTLNFFFWGGGVVGGTCCQVDFFWDTPSSLSQWLFFLNF